MMRHVLSVLALLAVLAGPARTLRADDDKLAKVKGGGVAAFDEGEEAFGLETLFSVHARVGENGQAKGRFTCELPGVILIDGVVDSGTKNPDGSVTLEGVAVWLDPDGNVMSEDEFFIVTLWHGGPGTGRFLYIDSFTGPAGDAETVTSGNIRIRCDD